MIIPAQLRHAKFVPIAYGEKGCKVKGWQSESNQLDYDALQAMGKTNYGVVAATSHLCLIDVDDIDHPKIKSLLGTIPDTFTVSTGKGYHFYYAHNEHNKWEQDTFSFQENKEEIMGVRLGNSYVVGPGSRHPDGRDYIVEKDIPVADITNTELDRILEFMKKTGDKDTQVTRDDKILLKDHIHHPITSSDPTDKFIFNYDINKVLQYFGIRSSDTIHPIHGSSTGKDWSVANNEAHCWRCKVHLGPLQLFALLSSRCECDKVNDYCKGERYSITKNMFLSIFKDASPVTPPDCIDLEHLVAPSLDDARNVLNTFALERGEMIAISGPTGKGKSVLATQLGIYLSIGKHTLGFNPNGKPLKVLMLQAEDSERTCIKNRDGVMQFLKPDEKQLAFSNFHITPRIKRLSGPDLLKALEHYHSLYQFDVVIFNPLSRFSSHIDHNDSQGVMNWVDEIEQTLGRLNCAGIAVMPTVKTNPSQRKNPADPSYSIYGSAKWGDAMRETIALRDAKLDNWMQLQTEKRSDDWGWKTKFIKRNKDAAKPFWHEASDLDLDTLLKANVTDNNKEYTLDFIPEYPETITETELRIASGQPRTTVRLHLAQLLTAKSVKCSTEHKAYEYYRPKNDGGLNVNNKQLTL